MQHTKYVDLAGHNIKQGYRLPLWEEGMEGLSTLLAENGNARYTILYLGLGTFQLFLVGSFQKLKKCNFQVAVSFKGKDKTFVLLTIFPCFLSYHYVNDINLLTALTEDIFFCHYQQEPLRNCWKWKKSLLMVCQIVNGASC